MHHTASAKEERDTRHNAPPELIALPQSTEPEQERARILRVRQCRTLLIEGNQLHAETLIRAEERLAAFYSRMSAAFPRHHLLFCAPSSARGEMSRTDLLRAHLRASLRLSADHHISVLLPALNTPAQIRRAMQLTETVMRELTFEGIPVDCTVQQGIRLSTPAAMLCSRALLSEADFALIDTDALATLVFGISPYAAAFEEVLTQGADALLRLIEIAVGNAHILNRFALLSGIAATDARLRPHTLAMGASGLVLPSFLLSAVARQLRR